jgi:hypothetical protein
MWRAILRLMDPATGSRTNCSRAPDYVHTQHICLLDALVTGHRMTDPRRSAADTATSPMVGTRKPPASMTRWRSWDVDHVLRDHVHPFTSLPASLGWACRPPRKSASLLSPSAKPQTAHHALPHSIKSWDQASRDMLQNSFGIHCKQKDIVCQAYKRTFQQHADGTCTVDLWSARPSPSPSPSVQ